MRAFRLRSAATQDRRASGPTATPVDPAIESTRVFDNLYFVGDPHHFGWALTTSQGIILLDAGFHHNVEGTIVAGMKKLGLDPAQIKYVIVSPATTSLRRREAPAPHTGTHRAVGGDWSHMVTCRSAAVRRRSRSGMSCEGWRRDPPGDAAVRMVVTPGHTPGPSLRYSMCATAPARIVWATGRRRRRPSSA